ncbi:hypothetical protein VIGAN_07133400 [Vigna angularis var. angularis]|uniref:Uncharacterized protein n=1 Tax=Vigna angularis var. angularis TaxID=157739 RepID=A0A0S3SI94_PHAAN|nr:hypothetical protein VIGAN_07133400 [Vigna angularis var. angularis]
MSVTIPNVTSAKVFLFFFLHVSLGFLFQKWYFLCQKQLVPPQNNDQNRGTTSVLDDRHCIQASNNMHSYRSYKKNTRTTNKHAGAYIIALPVVKRKTTSAVVSAGATCKVRKSHHH